MVPGKLKETSTKSELIAALREEENAHMLALQKLNESEQRFLSIFKNTDIGYFFIDKEGIIREVNPTWIRLYKYDSADEIIGHHFAEIQKLDDIELASQVVAGIMQGDHQYMSGEFSRRCMDNSIGYHSFSARPVNRGQEVIGIEGFIVDTTLTRLHEENFKILFNTMSQGVVFQDAEGKIITANPAAQELLGLSLDQMQGRSSADPRWRSIHEDGSAYPGSEHPAMIALQSGKKITNVIMGVYNPQLQTHKWLLINAIPQFRSEENTANGVFTTFTDFTEVKLADESLRTSENKLMNLYSNMSEGVGLHKLIYGEQGEALNYRIEGINPSFEKILGLKEEDILNKLATEVYGVPDPPFLMEYIEVVKSGKPASFEVYFPPMEKHFSISVSPWDNGGFATIFTDITARKQIELKLLESDTKFRSLAENSPYAILIYQNDLWIYSNPAGEKISGFTAEEIYSQKFWEIVAPEYMETVRNIGRRRQTGEKVTSSYEFRIITKTGKSKWVFLTGNTITFSGRPAGIISIVDITDRKQMEIDLKIAVERAQESDRLKSTFLANMSHEIRTPMNAILGFSELIGQPDTNHEELERFGGIIRNAGKRLLHIIDDIIDLSKLEAKQIEIVSGPCDVYHMLTATVDSFRNMDILKRKKELQLVTDIKDCLPGEEITTDPIRLQQVVDNLITNAIKYTAQGTITVGVNKISLRGKGFLEFFVRDTGKGIPEEKLPIIFERFRQVEENEYHEGAGLGLSICKSFIELLGGEIQVESEEGKGSRFSFIIPVGAVKSHEPSAGSETGKKSFDLSGRTIIIAEDEDDSFSYLEQLLKETKAKLLRSVNGRHLMEMLDKNLPDLLILDINMPGKTGYECLKEIRENGYPLKVIVQTAYAMADERKRCFEAGCDSYLAKPFNKKALFDSLAEIFNNIDL
ncbi:MAG: PAS domain S-box protein [Bacteroidetes bacterium]|nr:PAS domain S-box protein [Bacteroidota bacterium]